MDLATAKALLQRQEGSSSVYQHLTEVILKVLTEQPADALAAFESMSAHVKAAAYPAHTPGHRAGGAAVEAHHASARAAHLSAHAGLLKAPEGEEGATGEPVQDFTEESAYLAWGGVGFSRTDAFRLHLSLKHLAVAHNGLRGLRVWGKIFGTSSDYIIAEGQMDPEDDEPEDAKDALGNTIQRTGDGPNKNVYFVTPAVGGAWTKLPNVTPHQLSVARHIRRFFSGDLAAPVSGHPPFPGNESNYLRAQIALITAATSIAPSGMYNPVDGDEDGNIALNEEEWDAPDLTQLDSWVHTALEINALGRTKPNPPVINDEGEEVSDPDAPEASVPLRAVADDPPVDEEEEEGGGAWDVRPLPVSGLAEGESTNVTVLKSLRWPGAVTVGFAKKRAASLYVGFGHEVTLSTYAPALPAPVATEYDFTAEGQLVAEQADVVADPDEGKEQENEEGEAEE